MLGGAIPHCRYSWFVGVGLRHPVIRREFSFSVWSSFLEWVDRSHTELAYSAAEKHRATAEDLKVCGLAPHQLQVNSFSRLFLVAILFSQCGIFTRGFYPKKHPGKLGSQKKWYFPVYVESIFGSYIVEVEETAHSFRWIGAKTVVVVVFCKYSKSICKGVCWVAIARLSVRQSFLFRGHLVGRWYIYLTIREQARCLAAVYFSAFSIYFGDEKPSFL